jgi:hypothetical protein
MDSNAAPAPPHFEPPARRPSNRLPLLLFFAALGIGVCIVVVGVFVGFRMVQRWERQGPPVFDEKSALEPVRALDATWTRYRLGDGSMELNFPKSHERRTYEYEKSDRLYMDDYLSYEGTIGTSYVYFEAFKVRFLDAYEPADIADFIQRTYREYDEYKDFRYRWQTVRLREKQAAEVTITGTLENKPYVIRSIGMLHARRLVQFDAHADDLAAAQRLVERMMEPLGLRR